VEILVEMLMDKMVEMVDARDSGGENLLCQPW